MSETLDPELVDAYLARIGAVHPVRPDAAALRDLQERHVLSVPFENLHYYAGKPIRLDHTIVHKIVHERRGGGCYEVNPSFAHLLRALGFDVELLPARVWINGVLGVPLGHVVLRVRTGEGDWLVDVGFGRNSRHPLSLDTRADQQDPHGVYRLAPLPDGGHELFMNTHAQYRVEPRPIAVEDLRATLWWYRTSAESPFLQSQLCSLPTTDGRVTLIGRTLLRQVGADRFSERLDDDSQVIETYREHFGIELDEIPPDLDVDEAGAVRLGAS